MEIVLHKIPETTISKFADDHGLTMEVRERRRPVGDPMRFYASFAGVEVKDAGCLVGTYGDGATPEDAVADYATRIELRRLVVDAYQSSRREIDVPRLSPSPT